MTSAFDYGVILANIFVFFGIKSHLVKKSLSIAIEIVFSSSKYCLVRFIYFLLIVPFGAFFNSSPSKLVFFPSI